MSRIINYSPLKQIRTPVLLIFPFHPKTFHIDKIYYTHMRYQMQYLNSNQDIQNLTENMGKITIQQRIFI